MRDSEVVASIVARNPEGLAEAYDRYAARLFSFCQSLLREPAHAAGAVRDTFVIAASRVSELHDPGRLRPWLYAVARSECHRRLRTGNPPVTQDETAGPGSQADDDAHAQLMELVRTAISGLEPGDREVVELSLRHRLHGPDLADTLGVPRHDAHALVSRAQGQLQASLGALLVARAGRQACPALNGLLGDEDGTRAPTRDRVIRHIGRCPACGERQRELLGPVMRLGFAPLVPIPQQLRDQMLHLATDTSPATAARRTAVVRQAAAFGAYGFPAAPATAAATGPRWRLAPRPMAAITGAAATAVVAAGLIIVVPQTSHGTDSARPAQLSEPVSPAAPGGPGTGGGSAATPGSTGTAGTPASGARGPGSTARFQGDIQPYRPAIGALAAPGGSVYALSGAQTTGAAGTGTGSASTRPAVHPSSPGTRSGSTVPSKSTGPTKTTTPTKSTTPTSSPPPVVSPTPTGSPAPPASPSPVTSPTPSVTPSPSDSGTSPAGPTTSVSVGQLLSVSAQPRS